ncbi:MAG: flagellar hook-length control protein FliK [Nitrospinae bacterium]|nr:flagellar hook-length control protein FliK [Nitrospinota bacterium]
MINVNELTSILIKALLDDRATTDAAPAGQNARPGAPAQQTVTTEAQAGVQVQNPAPPDSAVRILAPPDVKISVSESVKKMPASADATASAPPEAAPAGSNPPSPSAAATADLPSGFSKGEVISATATKSPGPDAAVTRPRGTEFVAATPRPLTDGAPRTVEVEGVRPRFVHSLPADDARVREKTAALLRAALPADAPIADVITGVSELLPKLPPEAERGSALAVVMDELIKSVKNPDGCSSKNPAQLLGLSHESAISKGAPEQNLKRSLMTVRGNLEKMTEKTYGPHVEQLKTVKNAISNIELRQVIGAVNAGDVKGWQIPYWNGQKLDSGALYIGRNNVGNACEDSDPGTRLTLVVSMSDLGDVRAEAVGRKNRLDGTIYAGTDLAVKRLREGLEGLLTSLAKAGYAATIGVRKADGDFIARAPDAEAPPLIKNLLSLRV